MAKYTELIKNFDKIRDYMKDFFIYGYKTRSDFEYKSLRTYDNEKRRIESWLYDYINMDNSKKGKQVAISCDSGQLHSNPLYKAYYSKSFTDNDIELHFFITDVLIDSEPLSVEEITDKIMSDYGVLFESQTVRLKLNEYVKQGIIISEKIGKTNYFSLSKDTPYNICEKSENFMDMTAFFSQAAPFGVIGSYIMRRFNYENNIFLMKHNFIVHTLEDNIMLELIKAINQHRYIEIVNFGKNGSRTVMNGIPLKIHVSLQTGRRYIIMYFQDIKRFNSLRLDHIKIVKQLEVCGEYSDIFLKYQNNCDRCWGTSFGNARVSGNYETLRITFNIDEENEMYILDRLIREKRGGTVNKIAENTYAYEAKLFDSYEAGPWIKSFIGRIISVESSNEAVVKRFYYDIRKMSGMYWEE